MDSGTRHAERAQEEGIGVSEKAHGGGEEARPGGGRRPGGGEAKLAEGDVEGERWTNEVQSG